MESALDLIDENVKSIYNIDILTAAIWIIRVWNELSANVIQKCWRHTGILQEEQKEHRVIDFASL